MSGLFAKATRKLVCQADDHGNLIPVLRLNKSDKLVATALIVKRKPFWFRQKAKYRTTGFTLGDVLLGDPPLTPDVHETDFLTFNGTYGNGVNGKLEGQVGAASVNLEGRGSSKLHLSLGKLKKQEVNVKDLLRDSQDRQMDMQHALLRQMRGRRKEVLAVLQERLVTAAPFSIAMTTHRQVGLAAVLRDLGCMSGKNENNILTNSDVAIEIPAGTVVAYSVMELDIQTDGHFELCLQADVPGRIEVDSGTSSPSHDILDGYAWSDKNVLGGDLSSLLCELAPLAVLPQASAVFQHLRELLTNQDAVSYLENILEGWHRAEEPVGLQDLGVSGSPAVIALLELLRQDLAGPDGPDGPSLSAFHLLLSAIEELPDDELVLLQEYCGPEVLEAVNTQMHAILRHGPRDSLPLPGDSLPLPGDSLPLPRDSLPLLPQSGDAPQLCEWPERLLVVLCVTLQGLTHLCTGK